MSPLDYYEATKHQVRYKRAIEGPFEQGISSGQKKRIAKCEREGFAFSATNDLAWCHSVIVDNRARKGRPYSMTLEQWRELAAVPDTVYCFAVSQAAVAMCVRLLPQLLYVQAWGDRPGFESYSPVTLLARGIYRWCGENGFKTLDIGTADEPGLIEFKQRLGFHAESL